MRITFLSQRQLATLVMFLLSGLVEYFLMKVVPPGIAGWVLIISAIILFYLY